MGEKKDKPVDPYVNGGRGDHTAPPKDNNPPRQPDPYVSGVRDPKPKGQ